MKLSVVIPCFNEYETIRGIVEAVKAAPYPDKEIIVVDDGSSDGTRERLAGEVAPLVDRVIYHDVNRGKGAALRTGIAAATGDIVIVQDADREYDPNEYPTARRADRGRQRRRRLRVAFHGRTAAPRAVFLAQLRQWRADAALEHVHEPQSDGHGDRLQSLPPEHPS